jgi:hypothetical protein
MRPHIAAEPTSTKRAKPQALRNPSATAIADEILATISEFIKAEVSRVSFNTAAYQRSEGPVKGGIGKAVDCSENTTSTMTGKKMNV